MKFLAFGNAENKKMMFIHGFQVPWQVWKPQINYFSQTYYVIVPILHGHNPIEKSTFISVYKEAEAIGAKTIIVTVNQSMIRNKADKPAFRPDGTVMRKDRAPYAQAMKELAKELNVPCIDLFTVQKNAMELIGEEECAKFYCIGRQHDRYDPSHTNIMGAHFVANIIATELAKTDTPLAKEVNPKRLWKYKIDIKTKNRKLDTEK